MPQFRKCNEPFRLKNGILIFFTHPVLMIIVRKLIDICSMLAKTPKRSCNIVTVFDLYFGISRPATVACGAAQLTPASVPFWLRIRVNDNHGTLAEEWASTVTSINPGRYANASRVVRGQHSGGLLRCHHKQCAVGRLCDNIFGFAIGRR